ncbi:MAG: hypothetical protein Q8K92_13225 [Leadbetterella sp.]|nr:hypothetical protein [Leadbetterella sp.]
MKKLFTLGALLFASTAFAQTENVGIGTAQPDKSAILDLSSSNKGFLLPRMSESQRLTIVKPAQGLQVYQTDGTAGLYVFNGKDWENASKSVAAATDPWLRGGNAISAGEFIGTTNPEPLVFKVNGNFSGKINSTGLVSFGIGAGQNNSANYNIAMGAYSLYANTTGLGNVAIGYDVMSTTTTGVSGNNNIGIGSSTLQNNRGSKNIALGVNAMISNTLGSSNVAIGASAGFKNTTGSYNFALGDGALTENQIGSDNVGIGPDALRFVTGSRNVGIGTWSGRQATGSDNVFIGYSAGTAESGSNKLYIANTGTTTPLVYGDFAAKFVSVGDIPDAKRFAVANAGVYGLLVQKGILTEKLKVATLATTDWADYVFEPEYKSKMMSLEDIEKYTIQNRHLPNVPSAEEMVKTGLDYTQTSKMFMEKIEELTLYMIELNKEIKALKAENETLKKK